MTLFIPSLDKTNIYTTQDKEQKRVLTRIGQLFPECLVYHKLDVDHAMLNF